MLVRHGVYFIADWSKVVITSSLIRNGKHRPLEYKWSIFKWNRGEMVWFHILEMPYRRFLVRRRKL